MSVEELGLFGLSMPESIHADLAQQERLVPNQVLEPEQIAAERFGIVQVDVEGDKIERRQVEILGWRVTGIRYQPVRVSLSGNVSQFGEEFLDPASALPTDHVGRDFIAHAVRKEGRMTTASFRGCANRFARLRLRSFCFQETKVIAPGNVRIERNVLLTRKVKQPSRRDMVCPDGIDP